MQVFAQSCSRKEVMPSCTRGEQHRILSPPSSAISVSDGRHPRLSRGGFRLPLGEFHQGEKGVPATFLWLGSVLQLLQRR